MKTDDVAGFEQAFQHLLGAPLRAAECVHLAQPNLPSSEGIHGFHSHDAWELFCPLRHALNFLSVGRPPVAIKTGRVLLVPPGCLHMEVDLLPQAPRLTLLVVMFPGRENPSGGLRLGLAGGGTVTAGLSPADLLAWTTCVGASPADVLDAVARAIVGGPYERERALGLLRVLLAACAEVLTHPARAQPSAGALRTAEAQLFLQSNYYDPRLSVYGVAKALRISASHLGALFRKATGRTIKQTLIDIRLQRATDLLVRSTYSIKEISAMTGWSNQLYFSAAYRRRHGQPPSAVRRPRGPGQGRTSRIAPGSDVAAADQRWLFPKWPMDRGATP